MSAQTDRLSRKIAALNARINEASTAGAVPGKPGFYRQADGKLGYNPSAVFYDKGDEYLARGQVNMAALMYIASQQSSVIDLMLADRDAQHAHRRLAAQRTHDGLEASVCTISRDCNGFKVFDRGGRLIFQSGGVCA